MNETTFVLRRGQASFSCSKVLFTESEKWFNRLDIEHWTADIDEPKTRRLFSIYYLHLLTLAFRILAILSGLQTFCKLAQVSDTFLHVHQ